jgi:general stress protein YciG
MAERKQSESSHRGGSGNFAEDPEKASEAGRKGGEHSGGGRSASSGSTHPGGSGNFAEDRERASEAGRKGGQSRSDR